ncbi:MAG: PEGA domain-containing protein [Planctomycetes bacterium]|nr:PEGA domain-containing protein [Planctomycetota bacterium]
MRTAHMLAAVVVFCWIWTTGGCVERKINIRSTPSGADVWLDENYIGETPVQYSFEHYGRRRIRVGPVRDEKKQIQWKSVERLVSIKAPWYEYFPIDFLSEVVWPGRITDEHEFQFRLEKAREAPAYFGADRAEEVKDKASQFRDKALSPVPEQQN